MQFREADPSLTRGLFALQRSSQILHWPVSRVSPCHLCWGGVVRGWGLRCCHGRSRDSVWSSRNVQGLWENLQELHTQILVKPLGLAIPLCVFEISACIFIILGSPLHPSLRLCSVKWLRRKLDMKFYTSRVKWTSKTTWNEHPQWKDPSADPCWTLSTWSCVQPESTHHPVLQECGCGGDVGFWAQPAVTQGTKPLLLPGDFSYEMSFR